MYADGYNRITSIDFSSNAIDIMTKRAQSFSLALVYKVMDARKMTFENEAFDMVIDKVRFISH